MKRRAKIILISIAVSVCSLWWGAAHVLYRYTAFGSAPCNYYVPRSHEGRLAAISRTYERVITPLLQVLGEVNSPETARKALDKTTELCKIREEEAHSAAGSGTTLEIVGLSEWDRMVDELMRSETAAQEIHKRTTEKLLSEVARLEACDYYGCRELRNLICVYIYNNGVLQYLPSAPLRMAALTTADAAWGAAWESRLKREHNYLLDVLLLGTYRLLSSAEVGTAPAHDAGTDVYQLDPKIGLNGTKCPPMFGHYCPSCQYAEFTPNVVMSGKTLDKTQRLESMRIVELAQYSRDELMCHPLYMDSLMGEDKQERLFFMLSAPCKSPYLEMTLKDGKFYAMKYWDKVPGELQEKRTPEETPWW